MNFGEKLSELRRKKGLSQEELGYELNVTRQTISKWELGQSKPDTDKLKEISKLFDVDFSKLIDDEEILEEQISNNNEDSDEVRPRKWLLVVLIVIALILVVVLADKYITNKKEKKELEKENIKENIDGFFDIFDEFENKIDSEIENNNNEFEIKRFNNSLEIHAGSNYGTVVVMVLDKVITSNKKNQDKIINVIYGDINTTDESEIREIKRGLDDWTKYEIIFDYDEVGYINQVTIEN